MAYYPPRFAAGRRSISANLDGGVLGQEPCKHRAHCVALDLSAEFGILRQNEPMVVVTTVVSLVLYTLAQAPERVVSASLGVTAP